MDESKFNEDMAVIRRMIERSRRQAFESGYLFIIPGAALLVAVIIMAVLELTGRGMLVYRWGWTVFFAIALVSIGIGAWESRKIQAFTYTKHLFSQLWSACGIVIVLATFVLPHMNDYTPVVPFMVVGIGFFVTGAIYELPAVQLCGVVCWVGMTLLGFVSGPVRLPIWIAVILLGFVMPGIILNRQYRKEVMNNGS